MLRELIRIDTTNPPGNEVEAADRATEWMRAVSLEPVHRDSAPGRRNWMVSLGPQDDALILTAHLDVVPADPEHWRHPPFEAVIDEGCVWGRGAIDMKHMAAYALAIVEQLATSKRPLQRGLRVVLFADEEAGCEMGSLFVARNHPEWLRGRVALTEVGGFTSWMDDKRVYTVQVAEKGFVWLRLRVRGEPGHGSMPHQKNALLELARIIEQLGSQPFPFQCTKPAASFLDAVGRALGFPKGAVFRGLGTAALSGFILEKLVKDESRTRPLAAMFRNTVSPTMVSGGTKSNVIPGEAELVVDCRILPGTSPETFVEDFKSRIRGDYDLEVVQSGPAVEMNEAHPIVEQLFAVLRDADPGCYPVPHMLTGFTDARAFAEVGTPCFGFSPLWLPPDLPFAPMFHGHNERIPVDGFRWGLATLYEFVRRYCE